MLFLVWFESNIRELLINQIIKEEWEDWERENSFDV